MEANTEVSKTSICKSPSLHTKILRNIQEETEFLIKGRLKVPKAGSAKGQHAGDTNPLGILGWKGLDQGRGSLCSHWEGYSGGLQAGLQ